MRSLYLSLSTAMICFAFPPACPGQAKVAPAAVFADHMVLQRDKPVPIWGWATRGEKVMVRPTGAPLRYAPATQTQPNPSHPPSIPQLPRDGTPVPFDLTVDLTAGHELVFMPLMPDWNNATKTSIEKLSITMAP